MIFLLRFFCCLVFLGLTNCATQQKNVVKTQNIKQCNTICEQQFESCKQLCTDNCPTCSASSSHTSSVNYSKYVHEMQVEDGTIARQLKSYRDPLQCRKVTCSCSTDLMTCNQNCTGEIQKKLQSVHNCT